MSAPKLAALLSAIEPDGTVLVRRDRSGGLEVIEPLRVTVDRMVNAFGGCLLAASGAAAPGTDEFDDITELSASALFWAHRCWMQLPARIAV